MYVQWCLKGIAEIGDADVDEIFRSGLVSNWARSAGMIPYSDVPKRLTDEELDWHVNRYDDPRPDTGMPYGETTPFISLTAGAVARSTFVALNVAYPAARTALGFATRNATVPGFVFRCWVPVGLNPAVAVESVAEETRELNASRGYSPFALEGEVTAKVNVPPSQIEECWRCVPAPGGAIHVTPHRRNLSVFVAPDPVLNLRPEI